jgi:hypothetical protein
MALSDGFAQAPIKVSPGEHLRLRVEGDQVTFVGQHKGGLCYLRLRVQSNGSSSQKKFEP